MFKWLKKDPADKLRSRYAATMEKATQAQRAGKIPLFAKLTAEAEEIAAEIDRLEASSAT